MISLYVYICGHIWLVKLADAKIIDKNLRFEFYIYYINF